MSTSSLLAVLLGFRHLHINFYKKNVLSPFKIIWEVELIEFFVVTFYVQPETGFMIACNHDSCLHLITGDLTGYCCINFLTQFPSPNSKFLLQLNSSIPLY